MLFQMSSNLSRFSLKGLARSSLAFCLKCQFFDLSRNATCRSASHSLLCLRRRPFSFVKTYTPGYLPFLFARRPSTAVFGVGSMTTSVPSTVLSRRVLRHLKVPPHRTALCSFSSSSSHLADNPPIHPSAYFKTPEDASLFLKHFCRDESVMRWAVGYMSPKHRRKLVRQLFEEIEKDQWLQGGSANSSSSSQNAKTQADQIFVSLDLNQDGQVSQREFRTWYNLHFKPSFSHEKSTEPPYTSSLPKKDDSACRKQDNQAALSSVCNGTSEAAAHSSSSMRNLYCDNKEENAIKEHVEEEEENPLTRRQVFLVLFRSSIPYIGFGFMDNCLMLLCGEMIDKHLGVILHLTTLGAAGYGNMISCATGVVTGGFIERVSYRLGLPSPNLTSDQADSKSVKNLHLLGSVAGICIGCLIGMFPLLLLNTSHREDVKSSVHSTLSIQERTVKSFPD